MDAKVKLLEAQRVAEVTSLTWAKSSPGSLCQDSGLSYQALGSMSQMKLEAWGLLWQISGMKSEVSGFMWQVCAL